MTVHVQKVGIEDGMLLVDVSNINPHQPGEPRDHRIAIPLDALEDRRRLYNLDDHGQAFRAIIHEHYQRLNDGAQIPDSEITIDTHIYSAISG